MEEFREIPGYPNYSASMRGSIVSKRTGKTLKPLATGKYDHVVLCGGLVLGGGKHLRVGVHVVVATAWIGPRPQGMVINHKDGNPRNNAPDNLEWVTQSQNVQHAYDTGLRTINSAHRERAAALGRARRATSAAVDAIVRSEYSGKRGEIVRLASRYNVSRDVVRRIIREAV